jgi:hypothetical protein
MEAQYLSHLNVLLYVIALRLEARYSSFFTSQPSGRKQDTGLALRHSYPAGSSVLVSSYHLALRLTTRSKEGNISSCFTSDHWFRSKEHISSCFTSDNWVRSKVHVLIYVTTTRSEAGNISSHQLLPLSRKVFSDYAKLISEVLKLHTR